MKGNKFCSGIRDSMALLPTLASLLLYTAILVTSGVLVAKVWLIATGYEWWSWLLAIPAALAVMAAGVYGTFFME